MGSWDSEVLNICLHYTSLYTLLHLQIAAFTDHSTFSLFSFCSCLVCAGVSLKLFNHGQADPYTGMLVLIFLWSSDSDFINITLKQRGEEEETEKIKEQFQKFHCCGVLQSRWCKQKTVSFLGPSIAIKLAINEPEYRLGCMYQQQMKLNPDSPWSYLANL